MPNTYACKLVSNPNVPIYLPRVCTLVLFIRSRINGKGRKFRVVFMSVNIIYTGVLTAVSIQT